MSGQWNQHSVQQAQEHGVQRIIFVLEHLINGAEKKNLHFTRWPVREHLQSGTVDMGEFSTDCRIWANHGNVSLLTVVRVSGSRSERGLPWCVFCHDKVLYSLVSTGEDYVIAPRHLKTESRNKHLLTIHSNFWNHAWCLLHKLVGADLWSRFEKLVVCQKIRSADLRSVPAYILNDQDFSINRVFLILDTTS